MPVLDTDMWLGEEQRKPEIPEDALEEGHELGVKEGTVNTVILYNFYMKKIAN